MNHITQLRKILSDSFDAVAKAQGQPSGLMFDLHGLEKALIEFEKDYESTLMHLQSQIDELKRRCDRLEMIPNE